MVVAALLHMVTQKGKLDGDSRRIIYRPRGSGYIFKATVWPAGGADQLARRL